MLLLPAAAAAAAAFCLFTVAAAQSCPQNLEPISRDGWQPQMLIGLGAQKCGSGFIYKAMRTHPQILTADTKELHVFDQEDFKPTQENYWEYLKHWGSRKNLSRISKGKVLMEFTPAYLNDALAPCHVKHFFPNAKFLVTLRDPIYRTLSFMNMARGRCYKVVDGHAECPKTFMTKKWIIRGLVGSRAMTCHEWFSDVLPKLEEAQQLVKNNTSCLDAFSEDPWMDCPHREVFVLSKGLYAPQISRWLKLFDSSQFMFINAQELFADPESHWKKIARFAGLSEDWPPPAPGKHANEVLFVDKKQEEMTALIESLYEKPLEDLYQLFEEKGIYFTPMTREPYGANRSKVQTTNVLSYCRNQLPKLEHKSSSRMLHGAPQMLHGLVYNFLLMAMLIISLYGLYLVKVVWMPIKK